MIQGNFLELPSNWLGCSLGDVIDYGSTQKADVSSINKDTWVLELEDIEKQSSKVLKRLTFEARQSKSSKNKFEKGDVLYGKLRPYLNKVVIADDSGVCSSEIIPIRCDDSLIDSRYMFNWLKSSKFLAYVDEVSYGVNMPRLGTKDGKKAPFILAPLPEQKRIVEKLDSLLAQVDTIQQRLNNLPDIIKRFRQSVLAAAVSGKLTEQWRIENNVTDVEDSIKEILNDRSVKVTARTKFPQPHLKDEEYPIPDNWKWVSLDSLASKIVDGVHHKPVYTEEGVPFMSVKDIKNGKITFDFCKYISQETHKEIHPRCNPEKGDLLITKSGTIGRTAIVETDDIFDLFVSVALIKPASSEVNMHFVDLALRKWVNGIDISSRVVGTAIKNLHLRDMRVLAIPFAPIEEQTEIVRLVEQYFALADTLEKNLANAKQRVDNLTQSILAKAFRGELVPQDPNDEPADKLLARIKAARLEAEKLEKAAKKAAKASKK
ncbi:restriction endonuclease subunit S [Pseudoalteromonas distincta]|uniref:Type I restriction endonuclease subunit S n=1 Tax=Pseudoalteromonas distincta TaxID=77608 RepID=A0A4P9J193_9GAMM|nr:restriction endonuclease subunit S [Pseudoalteromonas distincta]QCU74513.1 type I restriction endonuclease subunit S [Pseudoalteromonas distincta]